MSTPTTATYTASPTVRLNGQANDRVTSLITAMAMSEQEGGLSSLELRLSNSASLDTGGAEYAFDAAGDLQLGDEIIIGGGDASAPTEIFRGTITGVEGMFDESGPPTFVVLAEDALLKARFKRRTQVFENKSLKDIISQFASDYALTPQIDDLDQNFGTEVQMNETDLSFMRRLLARVDADLQIVGTELHASPRANVLRGTVDLALSNQLMSARVTADVAHQITESTVKGWDVSNGSSMNGSGQENALGPGSGKKGSAVMTDKFSDRKFHSCHVATFNQAEVDALADAVRNTRARRFLRVHGLANGDPALRVGTNVNLTGLGDWFSNTYYVVRTRHLYDLKLGYRTEFEGECAFLGGSS